MGARPSATTNKSDPSSAAARHCGLPAAGPAGAGSRAPSARGLARAPAQWSRDSARKRTVRPARPPGPPTRSLPVATLRLPTLLPTSRPHSSPHFAGPSTPRRHDGTMHNSHESHGRIVGSGCHRPFKLPSEQRTGAGKLRRAAASASCQPWPDVQHNTARWLSRDSTQVGCKHVLRGAF